MKLIRPIMYFSRQGVSDIHWIIKKMSAIPEDRRREVTNHYEQLLKFNDGCSGRDNANEYLRAVAEEYRPGLPERVIKLKRKLTPTPPVDLKPKERKYNSSDGLWRRKIN